MKLIIYIILIFLAISCSNIEQVDSKNSYQIEFIYESDDYVYLYEIIKNNPVKIDSSKSNSGNIILIFSRRSRYFSSRI